MSTSHIMPRVVLTYASFFLQSSKHRNRRYIFFFGWKGTVDIYTCGKYTHLKLKMTPRKIFQYLSIFIMWNIWRLLIWGCVLKIFWACWYIHTSNICTHQLPLINVAWISFKMWKIFNQLNKYISYIIYTKKYKWILLSFVYKVVAGQICSALLVVWLGVIAYPSYLELLIYDCLTIIYHSLIIETFSLH